MILVVSGEGPSDIGSCRSGHGECSGEEFQPGPMAAIIDKIVEPIVNFSFIDTSAMEFISEARRTEITKSLPKSYVVGKKRDYESGYFFKEAQALASIAAQKAEASNCPVAAVLFRDTDGTRSTEAGLYETKWKSIDDGFRAANFDLGVPMVPKPKSEAWLLCALKDNPYHHCAGLEHTLSGNDNAPDSAKQRFQQRLNALGKTHGDLAAMVTQSEIDVTQIDMPSFERFRLRLQEVTRQMLWQPNPG